MSERHPVEALAKQPPRMRRRSVIVMRQRPADFPLDPKMPQITALRDIAGESPALQRSFGGTGNKHRLVVPLRREAVCVHPAAGEVVGGELEDGEPLPKPSRERIGGVVVLMRA